MLGPGQASPIRLDGDRPCPLPHNGLGPVGPGQALIPPAAGLGQDIIPDGVERCPHGDEPHPPSPLRGPVWSWDAPCPTPWGPAMTGLCHIRTTSWIQPPDSLGTGHLTCQPKRLSTTSIGLKSAPSQKGKDYNKVQDTFLTSSLPTFQQGSQNIGVTGYLILRPQLSA